MSTWQERQDLLEQMSEEQVCQLQTAYGGSWYRKGDRAATIKRLLDDVERIHGDDAVDRLLGLPTDAEQQVQRQKDSIAAARFSAWAACVSAIAAVLAIIISVIALIKSFGG